MAIGNWIKRRWLQQLERRGDLVAHWSDEAQALLDLGEDLIPGRERELSRDLYGLLVYAWAAQADRGAVFHAHDVLRWVRTRAWRGYADMPALLQEIRTALRRGETGERMVAFFNELAEKRSTYLLLPVVSRIGQHQGWEGPLPSGALRVDGLANRHADRQHGRLVRSMIPGGPEIARDRDVVLLAVLVVLWDKGPWRGEGAQLLDLVRAGLRRLHAAPDTVLAAVRADHIPGSAHEALADEVVTAAKEVAVRAPWLWLEALFLIENALAGPQWFETAFEVKIIPTDTML